MCELHEIKNYSFSDIKHVEVEVAASLFWADGCLCIIFAMLTHFKYTRVRVLNYSVCTMATSNMNWIWFFIFTSLSSIMSGLNLWLNRDENKYEFPLITGWFAKLCSILSLVFAVKYQWEIREEAYNNLITTTDGSTTDETTPILFQQNGMGIFQRPSKVDALFVGIFFLAVGFFIAAWIEERDLFYWIAHISMWLLQVLIFIMIVIIHRSVTEQGPSVFIKCLLLAGVLFNAVSDIPAYVWLECILKNNHTARGPCFDVLVGMVLLSHVAFFLVMRTEFFRLEDVAKWHIVDKLGSLETSESRLQR